MEMIIGRSAKCRYSTLQLLSLSQTATSTTGIQLSNRLAYLGIIGAK